MQNLNFKSKISLAVVLATGFVCMTSIAYARTINFATDNNGNPYTWNVKSGIGGPGNPANENNWGNNDQDVFLIGSELHLKVSQHADNQWYSSEVSLPTSLGYGKYTFDIDSDVNQLDRNLVAAPFLYASDTAEIDIEHSYWSNTSTNPDPDNLYYTVQPFQSDSQKTQRPSFAGTNFQDIINWQPDKIIFSTEQNGSPLASWTYTSNTDNSSNNFTPGSERVHINFWQYNSLPPLNATTSEFIVKNFTFDPYVAPASSTTSTPDPTPTPTSAPTSTPTSTSTTPTVNLNIRYQNGFVFSGPVTLATSTVITDDKGISTSTTSTTVLTALINAAQSTSTFSISDLQFSSYGYYLKCLYLASTATSTCDDWNYVVNNSYPAVGMDSYKLVGGENIYLYFGDSWKITTPNSTVNTNTSTPFYTWKYDYSDITHDWMMDPNDLVAITAPNPNPTGWWDTDITVSTTNSNDQGVAYYDFTSTGTYSAKITANDYSKWSNPVTVIVTDTPIVQTSTSTTTSSNPGSGSGGSSNNNINITDQKIKDSITKLISFLTAHQDADGKIVDGGTSDWAAIAFASKGIYADTIKNGATTLKDFIYNYNFTDSSEDNLCASYPRHILALLAAGVAKNDPKIIDLKNKINSNCVKNNSFGLTGINDDVFGLLALLSIDENSNSPAVQAAITGIEADQQVDGSFTWSGYPGADITGAAINALKYAQSKGVNIDNNIFTKAKQYLKTQQLADGGWGYGTSDALTTGWAVMGINALGENQTGWFNSAGKNPWYILTTLDNDHYTQSWDGGIDWFGTKHAVPALLGKSWPIILDPKVSTDNSVTNNQGGSGGMYIVSTSTQTTTTTVVSTTIPMTTTTTSTVLTTSTANTSTIYKKDSRFFQTGRMTGNGNDKIVNSKPTELTIAKTSSATTEPTIQTEMKSASITKDKNQTIDDLPLDTPTKRNIKKILEVSGGGALAIGAYLGFRLLKNMI